MTLSQVRSSPSWLQHSLESIGYGKGILERVQGFGAAIPFSSLVVARKWGKYQSTVMNPRFVVLLRHCHQGRGRAVWGCVGKIRASYLSSAVLSF